MRILTFVLSLLIVIPLTGQRIIFPTDSLHIVGKVKMDLHFSLSDLDHFPKTNIPDQVIYNQKGEIKDTLRQIQGVPIKDILSQMEIQVDKPKQLNEFYFVFTASDDYKVVFSWNEMYNTPVGDQCYIITDLEGKKINDIDEHILFMSCGDRLNGRRFVHGLDRIVVKRVD